MKRLGEGWAGRGRLCTPSRPAAWRPGETDASI